MNECLCVKELAAAMQVSTQFVYLMRKSGFKMHGPKGRRGNRTATVADAARWIEENEFRLVHGRGVTKKARREIDRKFEYMPPRALTENPG